MKKNVMNENSCELWAGFSLSQRVPGVTKRMWGVINKTYFKVKRKTLLGHLDYIFIDMNKCLIIWNNTQYCILNWSSKPILNAFFN